LLLEVAFDLALLPAHKKFQKTEYSQIIQGYGKSFFTKQQTSDEQRW
jgi:hypothetical protein